jgi:predicted PurR-regulated permease PerM
MIAAGFGLLWLFNYISSVSIPFLLAFVIGIITFPLVKIGDRFRIPRKISSFIVVLLAFIVIWVSIQITIVGVISEAGNIGAQLIDSVNTISKQLSVSLDSIGISQATINEITTNITRSIRTTLEPSSTSSHASTIWQTISSGIGSLRSAVTGVFSALFGVLIWAMVLYYLLSDYEKIEYWTGMHMGVDPDLGVGLVEDATSSMRDYFKGLTIKGLVTAASTCLTLIVFGVPLAIPIAIVTFIIGYVPFVGTFIAVTFAALVTFGAKGLATTLIIVLILVIINNVLEQIVYNRVVGDQLNMHPIVVLGTTILGLSVAGLLGATFATPLAAMIVRIHTRLKAVRKGGDIEGLSSNNEETVADDAGVMST